MWWYPYTKALEELAGMWIRFMAHPTPGAKVGILLKLLPRAGYLSRHLDLLRVVWKTLMY